MFASPLASLIALHAAVLSDVLSFQIPATTDTEKLIILVKDYSEVTVILTVSCSCLQMPTIIQAFFLND